MTRHLRVERLGLVRHPREQIYLIARKLVRDTVSAEPELACEVVLWLSTCFIFMTWHDVMTS